MEQPSPRIETERLILRRFNAKDLEAYFGIFSHPDVVRTLMPMPDRQEAWRNMAMVEGHWSLRGFSLFAVVEKETDRLVGRVGPWWPEGYPSIEIGWTLHPDVWGKGYALEAARASQAFIHTRQPALEFVIHVIAPTNTSSQMVAQRLGSAKSGVTMEHHLAGTLDLWTTPRPGKLTCN